MTAWRRRLVLSAAAGLAAAGTLPALAGGGPSSPALTQPTATDPLPGATRLPNGWALDPAGTQILTSRAPTGVAVAADGSAYYAVTSGIFEEAVDRIDPTTLMPTKTLVGDAFQGVAADASGNVFVSGGPANAIFHYAAPAGGPLLLDETGAGPAPATPSKGIAVTGFPGNMLLSGSRLFVAGNLSVPRSALSPGVTCPGGDPICSVVTVIDDPATAPAAAPATHQIAVGRDAYGLAYRPASHTLYVSNWAQQTTAPGASGTVSVVAVNADGTGTQTAAVAVGPAPAGIALSPSGRTLAVADSGSDTVSLLSLDPSTGGVAGTATVGVGVPGAPPGSAPLAVSYSPDGRLLFVALAGLDAVEVLDGHTGQPLTRTVTVSYRGRAVTVTAPTLIPTGWYPDAMAVTGTPGATRLLVANLRGNGAGPGYYAQLAATVGTSTEGTVSAIDLPRDPAAAGRLLDRWTAQVVQGDELAPAFDPTLQNPCAAAPAGGDILCPPAGASRPDPHTVHVVQILAENKTFDSYFGDVGARLPGANADPSFTEYGAAVTTNQHMTAQAFSLADNFWNEGAEASDLGHSWITGGYSTPYNELTWGQNYDQGLRGGRVGGSYSGTSFVGQKVGTVASDPNVAAQEQAMFEPRIRIADEAENAGLNVKVYSTDLNPGSPVLAKGDRIPVDDWGLGNHPVSTDLAFPDTDRSNIFLHGQTVSHAWDELESRTPPPTFGQPYPPTPVDPKFTLDGWTQAYHACMTAGGTDGSCQAAMPNYAYMTLSENHTYDISNVFNPEDPTPQSMVADNDYAIGLILQGLSHSPFWKDTLVLVTEDDNQYTGDHMDVHRTFLLAAGGLAGRLGPAGQVSHETGSFPSVLATEERLLGLAPMTMFDRQAAPMHTMVAAAVPASAPVYCAVVPPTPFLVTDRPTPPACPPAGS